MTRRQVLMLMAGTLLGLGLLAGCGGSNSHISGTFAHAESYRVAGKHREAVEAYSLFLRRSPTDSLATLAQFEKAMSYVVLKEFPLAVVEFQILRQEYPTSELVEEAFFREGEALLAQVNGVEKDITAAHEAREQFLAFLQTYPASPFGNQARARLVEISDLVVSKHLRSAHMYKRMKKYEATVVVLDRLLATERRSTLVPVILIERAGMARILAAPQDERRFLQRIIDEYPNSSQAKSARRRIASLPVDAEA